MNKFFGILLFLWVVGWTIAAVRTMIKKPPVTENCHCRTEYRTGLRLT